MERGGGQAPYGYDLDLKSGCLVINPEEAEVVRIIYDRYVNLGEGCDAIAIYLNQHGYTKKKMRDWELSYFTHAHIRKILENPVYMGKIKYGEHTTQKRKGTRDQFHRVKADDYIVVDGQHEGIVDEQLWLDAQERSKNAASLYMHKRCFENDHILSGLITCPVCGRNLTGMIRTRNNKNGTKKAYGYYRCAHGKILETGERCNYAVNWPETQMNQQVEQVILDMVLDSDVKDYIIRKMTEEVNVQAFEKEKERLLGQLRQTEGAKTKLISMMESLNVDDKYYSKKSSDMQNRLDQMYDKIAGIEESVKEVEQKIQKAKEDHLNAQQLYMILSSYDKLYSKMTDAEKKIFFHNLVDHIELVPGETDVSKCIKSINLVFPIGKDGKEGDSIRFRKNDTDETILLIDSWRDQKALDAHHASPMMKKLAELRTMGSKYYISVSPL